VWENQKSWENIVVEGSSSSSSNCEVVEHVDDHRTGVTINDNSPAGAPRVMT